LRLSVFAVADANRYLSRRGRGRLIGLGLVMVIAMIAVALKTTDGLGLRGTIHAGPLAIVAQ
jgi:hypothetical protein